MPTATAESSDPEAPVTPTPAQDAPPADPAGDEGPPVGTGTPLPRDPLPPSSGQAGAKKG